MRFSRLCVLGTIGVMAAAAGGCGSDDSPPASATTSASSAVATSPTAAPTESAAPPTTETPAGPPATTRPTSPPTRSPKSDLSQLRALGIDVETAVILDVADDGVDRFLQVGRNRVVDFTGTTRSDSTMMSLKAAPVSAKNRVVVKPPFWNEDTGAGSCVAATAGAALRLETCQPGKATQIFQVVPAGDSGQFELKGAFGILSVDNGRLTTGGGGRTGLQTLDFAG